MMAMREDGRFPTVYFGCRQKCGIRMVMMMSKTKYPINQEFFPYSKFTPSVSRCLVNIAQKVRKTPGFIFRDPDVNVRKQRIPSFRGGEIDLLILTPRILQTPAPCMVYIHGGGFVFEAAGSHYRHALTYAKEAHCVIVFVLYRLAPKYPFPYPQEDCYAALRWVIEHAEELGIDRSRIGIGGDSAGGTLTVTSCMMARDRALDIPTVDLPLAGRSKHQRVLSEIYRHSHLEFHLVPESRPPRQSRSFSNSAGLSLTRGSREL